MIIKHLRNPLFKEVIILCKYVAIKWKASHLQAVALFHSCTNKNVHRFTHNLHGIKITMEKSFPSNISA